MIWKILAIVFFIVCVILTVKLFIMRRSLNEMTVSLKEKLNDDTNTLITLATFDPSVRALAAELNGQLRILRKERLHLRNGNHELQNAITNIAHDLRTPLTAIGGYLELLDGTELPEKAREYASVIAERTSALCELTEDLFRYALINATADELKTGSVNVRSVLEESIAGFYQQLLSRDITPDLRLYDGEVIRQLDKNALRRVFDNLIGNAVKYSEGDLTITLSEDGKVSFVNTTNTLDHLAVGRLFDRFYTVESGRASAGIGLSVAKLLTEKMGGSIGAGLDNGKLDITVRF